MDEIKKNKRLIEETVDEYLHYITEHMGRGELDEREVRVLERCKSLGIKFDHHSHGGGHDHGDEEQPEDGEEVPEAAKKNK